MTIAGWTFPYGVLLLGVVTGLTYGLLAVGLVLVYRSSRFINFAHGEIGAFGAAILGALVTQFGVPYWVAFAVAIGASALLGAFTEGVLLRKLRGQPRMMSMVASLVLAGFLVFFSITINSQALSGTIFPKPAGFPQFDTGAALFTPAHSGMLIITPIVMVALFVFLKRSRFGLAIRAAAANPDAASMAGMSPTSMATMTWAMAGGISALTAILVLPTRGLIAGEAFGLSLLLPALAAAVIGRMRSLPTAFVAGIGAGLIERIIAFNTGSDGAVSVILFLIILGALLLQSRPGSRDRDTGDWLSVQAWPKLPQRVADLPLIRYAPGVLAAVGVGVALWLPTVTSNRTSFVLIAIMSFAIVGLSIGILTGLNGQLSLGQFAVAAFGAWAAWYFSSQSGSFPLGVIAGAMVGALASAIVGIPALRVRGLLLAVATLGLALATQAWFLQQDLFFGDGVNPGRPIFFGEDLDTASEYYYVVLAVLLLAFWFARNLRSSGFGRRLVGLRDNEANARAFTIHGNVTTLKAYAIAGALAGVGGAMYGHSLPQLTDDFFLAHLSIDVVVMTVVGGIGLLAGPLLGALYVVGVPRLIELDAAGMALHAFGTLLIVLLVPGGISGMVRPIRDRWVRWVAGRRGIDLDESLRPVNEPGEASIGAKPALAWGTVSMHDQRNGRRWIRRPLLRVENISKAYGGVRAVEGVSLNVLEGETVGLVGPNGAGKTTLFELISGFVPSDTGRIEYLGRDITALGPEARAEKGIVRSFQDATLFPTLTLLETVMLAQERVDPSRLYESGLGLTKRERAKRERARDLIDLMGLDQFRDKQTGQLSTGTRRIAEMTCMLALEPRLLLLDEPAAGVAQRETEALGELLASIKRQLNTTMIIIEHDIPLLAEMSDWMVAMESGRLLVEGQPHEVQEDEKVIDSFLGGDATAIQRSGAPAPGGQAGPGGAPPDHALAGNGA